MIDLNQLSFIGSDLKRPECVLCTRMGNLYVSDWRGGITQIQPNGDQSHYLAKNLDFDLLPNGIALIPDGSFLVAHLGSDLGGVYQLARNGKAAPILTEIDGEPLPPTNFVHLDAKERIWISVSTRIRPRAKAYTPDVNDGFLVLVDQSGARVVKDGLGYTNECVVDPSGQWLYVNETFARRLSRFQISEDGSLDEREIVTQFGAGVFPDGLTFDVEGHVWITSIVSNQVIRVSPSGKQQVILRDADDDHVQWVEQAFQAREMGRPHLDGVKSRLLKNISSLAFGGKDLRTAYLGCLLGDQIVAFTSEVPGVPPLHWEFDG